MKAKTEDAARQSNTRLKTVFGSKSARLAGLARVIISARKKIITSLIVFSLSSSSLFTGTVYAQTTDSGTLEKINKGGVIILGHREASIPFSYYDQNQQVIGYSQDFADQIVQAIKKKLNKPNLNVIFRPITSQNRITLLQNGTIDIECGSTTNNRERQHQVAFSDTIFVVGARLLVKKGSGIKDFSDLKGKTVVTTAGTTSERLLRAMKNTQGFPQNIISGKDHGEAFLALESGRAAAFMMDDALLAGERAKSSHPENYEIVGKPQSHEAYACMMRKNDPGFKKVVDATIAEFQHSGKAEQIYKRWFLSPIPPKNINLNFQKSQEITELYKNPNDRPLD